MAWWEAQPISDAHGGQIKPGTAISIFAAHFPRKVPHLENLRVPPECLSPSALPA
jgi:hypothetical protein